VDEGRLFRQTGEISGASDLLVIEIERRSHLHQLYITIQTFRRGDESDRRGAGKEWPAGSLLGDSWLDSSSESRRRHGLLSDLRSQP